MLRPGVKRRESAVEDFFADAWSSPAIEQIASLGLNQRRVRGSPSKRKEKQIPAAAVLRIMDDGVPCDASSNVDTNYAEAPESIHSFPMELGMEFESEEDALSYYNKYAGTIGFSTRKGYVNKRGKDRSGVVTSRRINCYKEGFRGKDKRDALVKNHRKDTRTGCLAHIVIALDQTSEKYRVTSFEAEHNHPLAPRGTTHMLPSQRRINKEQAHQVDDSVARRNSSREGIAPQANGVANFSYTDEDKKNFLCTKRQRDMELGEAGILLDYFEKQRLEDLSFYFSMQLDVDDSITNVFWADAKMVMDYKLFGDVVSFDITYRTNRSCRPFGLFAGMNHYRKMVVFGAVLMYDETVDSFQWLLETFLKAMSGRKPKTILTDDDAAISKAISSVMPEACHRLCVWHMGQNALKHLNHVFRGSDSFGKDFYKCIYEFDDEDEFLKSWGVLLDKYNLRDNDWLKVIFASREKWAMVYGRNTFSAGMRSSQLSKSFNNSLREYLKSEINLLQFLEQFEKAVEDKRYKELEASYDMTQRIPRLKMDLPLLMHARDIYTPVIFEMFQDEWAKSLLVVVNSCMEDGPCYVYKVCTTTQTHEHRVIAKPSDILVSCSCKKFESLGILCSHALKILDMMNVKMLIPSHYILKRWTKDARSGREELIDTEKNPTLRVTNRYQVLHPAFVRLAARASESQAGYQLAAKYANELAAKLETISKAEGSVEVPAAPNMVSSLFE